VLFCKKRWPAKLSSRALWNKAKQQTIEVQITERNWGWIGPTLRKPNKDLTREALKWNPQGARRRGSPRMTSRRTIKEINSMGKRWKYGGQGAVEK
jgi:hypothetical protein